MLSRTLWAVALLALPIFVGAQTHPCLDLLQQSAHAGVAAKICNKQVNMETLATLHQQHQCAAFFAQDQIKSQLNALATQASKEAAKRAQQLGELSYCQQSTIELGAMLK